MPAAPVRSLVAAAVLAALAGPGRAADPFPVKIVGAGAGLPSVAERNDPIAKFGAWVPVYVSVQVLAPVTEPAELVVESPDADGVTAALALPLDLAGKVGNSPLPQTVQQIAYVRPAAGAADTTVTVRVRGTPISDPFRVSTLRPKDPLTYVVLGLGSRLPGFELPRPSGETEPAPGAPLRGGRVEVAAITDLALLPDSWIGYDAADLVVLTSAEGDLFEKLFSPAGERKRAALAEWVRRGGRLVVSVGEKGRVLAELPAARELLPATAKAAEPVRTATRLPLYWQARESSQTSTMAGSLTARAPGFPVTNLEPTRPGRVLIPPPSRQGDDQDVIAAQSAFGLGRVTVIGFDLDRPPFTGFASRAEFWDWVLREGGASRASVGSEGKPRPVNAGPTDDEDELAVALRTHVDTFDGVPVISFGWVAVLIGFYLVLVGPVELYVLRRILGRAELTWLTLPVIAVTVSVLAYLSADAVKGRDLRVNAVEVIDVVPEANGRVYGTTWYSVFSPRIERYTVGVSPAEKWAAPGAGGDPVLGWVGGPRGGRASLLRRRYEVHTDPGEVADGLVGVPVPVWSTKAFAGNWSAPLDAGQPVVESRLEHPPGDPARAIGTFVTRMPLPELTDAVAFYAGQAYPLGTLVPDAEVRLVLDRGQPAQQYLQERAGLAELLNPTPGADRGPAGQKAGTPGAAKGPGLPLWGVLFHEAALRNDEGVIPRNASLRRLDQSWRLSPENRDEVIVVARAPVESGRSPDLTGGPGSASRLWLTALPGGPRPAVPGVGRTETWVRVYLPVK